MKTLRQIQLSFIRISALLLTVGRMAVADPIIVPLPGGGGEGPIILPVENVVRHCASDQYRYNECRVRGRILNAEITRQYSHAACLQGRTFGFHGNTLWVDRGCRANFLISFLDPHSFSEMDADAEELEE